MLREFIWRLVAHFVTRPAVASWLIHRAQRTPYYHIHGKDGSLYMGRWWLFNPYPAPGQYTRRGWRDWVPSVRVHHIMRPDSDRHLHDHPWNARTIVLRGWYIEELPGNEFRAKLTGDTGRLLFGQYHRIDSLSANGVWTLFITWRKRGTWGFDVDGVKVPWREYLGVE